MKKGKNYSFDIQELKAQRAFEIQVTSG